MREPHIHPVPDGGNLEGIEVELSVDEHRVGRIELLGFVVERVDPDFGEKSEGDEK